MIRTNFLIIGRGVAGLTLAIKLAENFPHKKICLITKAGESNTHFAQGGIATVSNFKIDSYQKHIEDTLTAGDGLCDPNVVEKVVVQGSQRLRELMNWGVQFDMDIHQKLVLGREGGHSRNRVVHHKDATGREIERALNLSVQQLTNIQFLNNCFAVDLIGQHTNQESTVLGAYVLNQNTHAMDMIMADTTTLATGGIGQLFAHTTNPGIATADGIAMASRLNAKIKGMEFIQFHPTVLYQRSVGTSFLISEAIRGFGAYIRNSKGERFLFSYDGRAELASRDIVSRGIDAELKSSGANCVYLDCTHLNSEALKRQFPTIYQSCLLRGFNITKDWIPVIPAVHYLCGGIVVDIHGRTSVNNLFACGECASTGLHGANRLASNSLLEALVYAHEIFRFHLDFYDQIQYATTKMTGLITQWTPVNDTPDLKKKIVFLKNLMSDCASIVRSYDQLENAKMTLQLLQKKLNTDYSAFGVGTRFCEYKNMLGVARIIVQQSLERKENKGGYFNRQLTG